MLSFFCDPFRALRFADPLWGKNRQVLRKIAIDLRAFLYRELPIEARDRLLEAREQQFEFAERVLPSINSSIVEQLYSPGVNATTKNFKTAIVRALAYADLVLHFTPEQWVELSNPESPSFRQLFGESLKNNALSQNLFGGKDDTLENFIKSYSYNKASEIKAVGNDYKRVRDQVDKTQKEIDILLKVIEPYRPSLSAEQNQELEDISKGTDRLWKGAIVRDINKLYACVECQAPEAIGTVICNQCYSATFCPDCAHTTKHLDNNCTHL
jgi:hypothetical protein